MDASSKHFRDNRASPLFPSGLRHSCRGRRCGRRASPRVAIALFAIALFASFLLALQPAQAAPASLAIVHAERGLVQCERAGMTTPRALFTHAELYTGDTIETGPTGEVDLLFCDGSQVKLNANTKLVITSPVHDRHPCESLFQALCGVLWAHLRPGQTIQSPSANIVVRGTEVLIDVTPARTILTVTEGDATLVNAQGAVDVVANEQSTAEAGKAPTPPVAVDVTGLIAWTADVAGLPLEFTPPASAAMDPDTRRGDALRAQGDLPGALAAYGRSIQTDPDDAQARVGMALTYLSQGKDDQARDALAPVQDQAQPRAILGLAALHEGKGAEAAQFLNQALAEDPALTSARSLLALAQLTRNDLSRAVATAQDAARRDPKSAQAAGTLAMTLFFSGRQDEATDAARRACRLDPLSPFALLAEGRTLLAAHDLEGARAAYEKAAAIAPRLWLAHQELATVYLAMDMPRKAAEEDQIALALNPRSSEAETGLGLAAERQGRFSEAESDHEQALALNPSNVTALYDLGALYVRRGELGKARQVLAQAAASGPERGVVYARLAEVSLYRQDLFDALELARQGVSLSPASSLTHYELGRVYLEQDRTVQAEQEFREAVTLDPNDALARYALGLTQEKTDNGLLTSFDTLLGSAIVGSPGTTGQVQNLETPGANERIQAVAQDPTAIRAASRSYGDTEIDGQLGELGTRDEDASYLHDTSDGRGIVGVEGEEQATNGVRTNADSRMDDANFVFGQKAPDNPSSFFLTGDYEDMSMGENIGIAPSSIGAIGHDHVHLARAIAGANLQSNARSRVRAIVQISQYLNGSNYTDYSFDYNKVNIRSVSGEVRWDQTLSPTNTLVTGFSLGNRTRHAFASSPGFSSPTPFDTFTINEKYQPYQVYLRDEAQVGKRTQLISEAQVQTLDYFFTVTSTGPDAFSLPSTSKTKTSVLPCVIAAYQADAHNELRLRYRRLFATLDDLQLLTPTDVFLISFAELPQPIWISFPSSDGDSTELEYDHTFGNASFLSLAAAQQDIRQDQLSISAGAGGPYAKAHVRIASGSYEGLFSRDVSFALIGNANYAHDSDTSLRIAQVPAYDGLATLQYLNKTGAYAQTAFYFQGDRVTSDTDRAHQGGFGVLNLRGGKRFGLRTNLFLQLNNVLNKKYDVGGLLEPNRQFVAGVSLRF